MKYVTAIGLSGYCPHLNEDVTLSGKYVFFDDDKTAVYRTFTCPVEENFKLPFYEQCEKYKYLRPCINKFDCPIAKNFKKEISF